VIHQLSCERLREGFCHRDFPCSTDTYGAQKRNFLGVPTTKNAFHNRISRQIRDPQTAQRWKLHPCKTCAHVHCHEPSPTAVAPTTATVVWLVASGSSALTTCLALQARLKSQRTVAELSRRTNHKNASKPHYALVGRKEHPQIARPRTRPTQLNRRQR